MKRYYLLYKFSVVIICIIMLLVVKLSINIAYASIYDGLILHYGFDNESGPVIDKSGNGNNGYIIGQIKREVIGLNSKCFEWIEQGNNRVESSTYLANDEFTLSMWLVHNSTYDYETNHRGHLFGGWTTADGGKDGWKGAFDNDGNVIITYRYENLQKLILLTNITLS